MSARNQRTLTGTERFQIKCREHRQNGGTKVKSQTFGIEIEMTKISRARAAEVIARHFGTTVRYTARTDGYDCRRIAMSDGPGRDWKVVSDVSIEDIAANQTEVVSPICRWEDIPTVQQLVRELRAAGARAHSSCGIHIHIGVGDHTARTLRNLVNIVNSKENLLTMALEIEPHRRARYCKPVEPEFLNLLNTIKPDTLPGLARVWYDAGDWQSHARQHYDRTRYHLLNLHSVFQKGTIEFRAFNSTMHAGEIKAYIQLCMAISHAALTARSANPAPTETDNPAYTFRCWLLRLGMSGDEFKTARLHLLKHLPGNAAWRHGSATARRQAVG